jgi:hypothetical protein
MHLCENVQLLARALGGLVAKNPSGRFVLTGTGLASVASCTASLCAPGLLALILFILGWFMRLSHEHQSLAVRPGSAGLSSLCPHHLDLQRLARFCFWGLSSIPA